MNIMGSVKPKKGWIKKLTDSKYAVPAIGLGLMLILLFVIYTPKGKSVDTKPEYDAAAYASDLETRMEKIIGGIEGVEECDVMITLKSGIEYKYASDTQISDATDSNEKKSSNSRADIAVVADKERGETAVVVKEIYPEISGVAVICRGTDSNALRLDICNTASTVLGVGLDKVYVLIK